MIQPPQRKGPIMHVNVRMSLPNLGMLTNTIDRVDAATAGRLKDQLWLRARLIIAGRQIPEAERGWYRDRADRLLALLDPADAPLPGVELSAAPGRRIEIGPAGDGECSICHEDRDVSSLTVTASTDDGDETARHAGRICGRCLTAAVAVRFHAASTLGVVAPDREPQL